jgi:hypothetical protein
VLRRRVARDDVAFSKGCLFGDNLLGIMCTLECDDKEQAQTRLPYHRFVRALCAQGAPRPYESGNTPTCVGFYCRTPRRFCLQADVL